MNIIKEFFGIGGYQRVPEGAYSWQHLTFVGLMLTAMTVLAVWLGRRHRHSDPKTQNRALVWAALLIDGFELLKIYIACLCSRLGGNPWYDGILYNLPLFLCSIQLITLPLAAFTKGRVKAASVDFVAIFGLLGGVLGTVGAAQNYACYPVLGFDNVVSAITHCLSGFAALYILVSGMTEMKWQNLPITLSILGFFAGGALVANSALDYNYMFLRSGDGTPYDVLYNLVGGHPILYPAAVIALFVVYILAFCAIWQACHKKKEAVSLAK